MTSSYAVIGGAGFIGSHFVTELLKKQNDVVVVDNFCSGSMAHLEKHLDDKALTIKKMDVENTEDLVLALKGIETVIHLASNPDIAKAATDPRVDFLQGTVLTESVVESARRSGVKTILYASGSGVYGDAGETLLTENSQVNPISTYGASKLAGEALLASYAYMFGIRSTAFRFANVVGPMQTHGVGYDFVRRLRLNPNKLQILGNGKQSKSYVHVSDVVSAVLGASEKTNEMFDCFNISTKDSLSVDDIAQIVFEVLGINPKDIDIQYTGGDRGWKADVPIVRLDASKIENMGWNPKFTCREAMKDAIEKMFDEII